MSGFVETLLKRYEEKLQEQSVAALASPQGRDSFEYGRMCGLYGGLNLAKDILLDTLRDAQDKDDAL